MFCKIHAGCRRHGTRAHVLPGVYLAAVSPGSSTRLPPPKRETRSKCGLGTGRLRRFLAFPRPPRLRSLRESECPHFPHTAGVGPRAARGWNGGGERFSSRILMPAAHSDAVGTRTHSASQRALQPTRPGERPGPCREAGPLTTHLSPRPAGHSGAGRLG